MKTWNIIWLLGWMLCLTSCRENERMNVDCPSSPVVILYENDVHCALDGYASLAAVRDSFRNVTPYVSTVSCGDFVQGNLVGLVSNGEYVVDIMNKVGYDVVAIGNHEFDFGIPQMFKLTEALDATVVNANFRDLRTNELPFAPYHILRYGDVDIAFIGFITTATFTSVSPKIFCDEAGTVIYGFTDETFISHAQDMIDKARSEGADYVVALSHLGDTDREGSVSSIQLISQTKGLDVVLDGHDHRVMADKWVNDVEGKPVLLSSTGEYFNYIGVLTLSQEGTFSTQLLPSANVNVSQDSEVQTFIRQINENVSKDSEKVVGFNEVRMSINDKEGNRIVRSRETNIGNLCTDAFRVLLHADVALINGGGIRTDLPMGEITYNDLYCVFPFNNIVCTATMTGLQLKDALEFAVSYLPEEDGTFMQVSGMKFEIDTSVPSPVLTDENGLFLSVGEGVRRVNDLQILDTETRTYQPVDEQKTYIVASIDYLLNELGGSGIFRYSSPLDNNLGQDVDILATYIKTELNGRIGDRYINVEGRIRILPTTYKL